MLEAVPERAKGGRIGLRNCRAALNTIEELSTVVVKKYKIMTKRHQKLWRKMKMGVQMNQKVSYQSSCW